MRRVVIGLIAAALLALGFALPERSPSTSSQSNIERVISGAKWAVSHPNATHQSLPSNGREAAQRQIVQVAAGAMVVLAAAHVTAFVTSR